MIREGLEHHFKVEDAIQYGIEKAVLLYNLRFWLDKNVSSGRAVYSHTDGNNYHWTFNSAEAFSLLFPYIPCRSVSRYLKELSDDGIVLRNSFNKSSYDKTLWYSMPQYITNLPSSNLGESEI